MRGSVALVVVLGWTSAALAASELLVDAQELASRSNRVVVARVLSVEVTKSGPLRTAISLSIEEDVKGAGAGKVELIQLGGRRGEWEQRVAGAPQFVAGERALLFLRCDGERCTLPSNLAKIEIRGDRVLVPAGLRHPFGERLQDWRAGFRLGQRRAHSGPAKISLPHSSRRQK